MKKLRQRGINVELFNEDAPNTYDIVVIRGMVCYQYVKDEKESELLEKVGQLRDQGTLLVLEDCDNHFYNPKNLSDWGAVARCLKAIGSITNTIVVPTAPLALVMKEAFENTKPVVIIGDAVEEKMDAYNDTLMAKLFSVRRYLERMRLLKLRLTIGLEKIRGTTHLVWFGNHGSQYAEGGMLDLLNIKSVLENQHKQHPLSLTVISNSKNKYDENIASWRIPTRYVNWDRLSFTAVLKAHSVALIPIAKNPFTVCKSNNRVVLSLYSGLAVVADSIPSYEEFNDVCFLDNWHEGLTRYLTDKQKRERDVLNARLLIEQNWNIDAIAGQWEALFLKLIK